MNNRFFRKMFTQSFFSNQYMFKNISIFIRSWVFVIKDKHIPVLMSCPSVFGTVLTSPKYHYFILSSSTTYFTKSARLFRAAIIFSSMVFLPAR